MSEFAAIFIGACLVNNLVLDYLLGISPEAAAMGKVEAAVGMSVTMIAALIIATLVTYPVNDYLLIPLGLEYLRLISFVFVITLAILLGEIALKRFNPAAHGRIAGFIPLILLNTACLGAALLNVQQTHGFAGALFFGAGTGAGFALVMVMMAAMQARLQAADVPQPFRGVSILLITFGILSMAFMGFNAMVNF